MARKLRNEGGIRRVGSRRGPKPFVPTQAQREMVIALAAIPRPNKMIASLIINPADGKPIDEELLALAFADEIKQAQAKYDLLCSRTIAARMEASRDPVVNRRPLLEHNCCHAEYDCRSDRKGERNQPHR